MTRAAALAALVLAAPPARADPAAVYRDTLKSVVWLYVPDGAGRASTGTGTLVDKDRKLVLTNFHVVGSETARVRAVFPRFLNGKLKAEREFYLERLRTAGLRGTVEDIDRRHDLALVRLTDDLPDEVRALPLATEGVSPGQAVHSIGNPGKSGALWVYTQGKVRQVYAKRWQARVGNRTVPFESEVIETDSATNPGDSGGPLVNDDGQLVGVTQGGAADAQLLSLFIDLSEVKRFLARNGVRPGRGGDAPPKAMKRTEPFAVRDGAKMFGEAALKDANDAIKQLHAKAGADLLIETFAAPPGPWAAKIKDAKGDDRGKLFQELAAERARGEKVNGVYVFICKTPGHLRILYDGPAGERFSTADVSAVGAKLLARFKKNEFDDGLREAVRAIAAKLGGAK